ncbi:non-ribosomal peptide synthetase [Nocardia australiensis]|uniref:non-ribosomal peptide synthetase n=1 Tax=Nocardia australiensis TaxID=2887191 RepID=UPI001D151318|nr:non-ribosomal peptide synthetase [Nocardia australiensis]
MSVDRSIPAEIEDVLALSPLQEGLFSLAQLAADGVDLYTMQFVIDVGGPVDVALLRRSAEVMLERHANLRVSFWDKDIPKPVQIVPSWVELPWAEMSARPEEFDAIAEADRRQRFDLGHGPALRITLVTLPDERRRMIVNAHHILMDGWAVAVFFRELIAVYEAGGQADSLPSARPYRDYIGWLAAHDATTALQSWTEYLADLSGPLMLADGAAAQVGTVVPRRTRLSLDLADTDRLVRWARASGLTMSTVVQFAWAVVLGRLTDRRDVVFGTTISGRPDSLPGVETMIGLFINTVPARVVLDRDDTVGQQCARMQRESAAMRDAGYVSLSNIQRAAGHGALFDVLFVFENAPIGAATDPIVTRDGTRFLPVSMESLVHYPLSVVSYLNDGVLVVMLEAIAEALPHFPVTDIGERMLAVLRQLPDHTNASPDTLDVLLPAERAALATPEPAQSTSRNGNPTLAYRIAAVLDSSSPAASSAANHAMSALDGAVVGSETVVSAVDSVAVSHTSSIADSASDARADTASDSNSIAADTVPELFSRQAELTPDSVALSSGDQWYTYRELRCEVGRLAGELAEHGVGPESVVALVLPRSVRSIIAILAVLEAGGAYVPIDVSAPAARVESMLRQAGARLMVTVGACLPLLDGADQRTLLVLDDPVVARRIAERAISTPRPVPAQSFAYLIFTSGSTGEPKGVMGTHAALASYFADHRDRVYCPAVARLGRSLRIAHAWSLSFDASWQPMIGLLDGHAVHLFDESEMRDAQGLVAGIVRHEIDMIDTSPSMFTQLSAAGLVDGERLTVLALGGEAIGAPMWKALRALPGTAVYNCYGPTETTVEAVVATVNTGRDEPGSANPTIGGPVDRMAAYVFDTMLRPVPRGVVGELYLSGAQLARGYIGRPAATADRFVADPFRPGARMYRTGDLVRQLPEGDLAYLGRADDQVKIRGYRIEIGDIETALLRLPQVRAGAVVVLQRPSGPTLVAFAVLAARADTATIGADSVVLPVDAAEPESGLSGGHIAGTGRETEPPTDTAILGVAALRSALTACLPAYMVPARIISVPELPVTPNGKLDVRALTSLGLATLQSAGSAERTPPRTETERTLCVALADALGGTSPGIDDDFIALGMDSIVAISLVNAVRRAGLSVSPAMVMADPTVRDLAAAIEDRAAQLDSGASVTAQPGEVLPTPIMSWMYEHGGFRRLALSTLVSLPADSDRSRLESVLQALLDAHDMLRARVTATASEPRLETRAPGSVRAFDIYREIDASTGDFEKLLEECSRAAIDRIDPFAGIMIQAVRFRRPDKADVLLLSIHHLAVDPVSWHIILADLADAWQQLDNEQPMLTPELTGYRQWSELLNERRDEPEVLAQRDFWSEQLSGSDPELGLRRPDPSVDTWSSYRLTPSFTTAEITRRVLTGLGPDRGMREFLLTALAITLATWRAERDQDPSDGALVALEGHGREDATVGAVDTSRTVGWFTTVYPVRVGAGSPIDITRAESDPYAVASIMKSIAVQLDSVPNKGLDYGILRYGGANPEFATAPDPQIMLDYLGRMDLASSSNAAWSPITDLALHRCLPIAPEPEMPLRYALDLVVAVYPGRDGPQLATLFRWSDALFDASAIDRCAAIWQRAVAAVAHTLQDNRVEIEAAR